jgi:hypothetical protein
MVFAACPGVVPTFLPFSLKLGAGDDFARAHSADAVEVHRRPVELSS